MQFPAQDQADPWARALTWVNARFLIQVADDLSLESGLNWLGAECDERKLYEPSLRSIYLGPLGRHKAGNWALQSAERSQIGTRGNIVASDRI